MENEAKGWKKLLTGYPWFNCEGWFKNATAGDTGGGFRQRRRR